jgi:hypothetical protein
MPLGGLNSEIVTLTFIVDLAHNGIDGEACPTKLFPVFTRWSANLQETVGVVAKAQHINATIVVGVEWHRSCALDSSHRAADVHSTPEDTMNGCCWVPYLLQPSLAQQNPQQNKHATPQCSIFSREEAGLLCFSAELWFTSSAHLLNGCLSTAGPPVPRLNQYGTPLRMDVSIFEKLLRICLS